MIYKFDNGDLTYKKITNDLLFYMVGVLLVIITITSMITINYVNNIKFISEETKGIIIREADENNKFSKEKLKLYILELNIKYPRIVLAQTILETGNYTSDIFRINNNLFGLKGATRRPSTSKELNDGYAYFKTWRESVVDYAFLQSSFIFKIHNENEYLEYLKQKYAEDPNYIIRLKAIIKNIDNNYK
jgi:hypothetical protein